MTWDWNKFAVGGATRPDSFSGMQGGFSSALEQMFANAPPEIQSQLRVGSGFRSPERQAQLWSEALAKYGSPEAARKWVAPPGKSQHGHGNAADLKYLDPAAREWAHQNAAQYGLAFPLSNEPWHVELASARGGQAPKPQGILGNITGGGGNTMIAGNPQQDTLKPEGWLTQDRKDALIVGLEGMTMNPNEALVEMAGGRIKDRRAEAKSNAAKSKTTEWLRSIGRDDLAAAVESGSVDGGAAAGVAFTDKRAKDGTAEEQAARAAQGQSITAMGRPDLGQMVADGILSAAEAGKLALEGKEAPKPLSPEGMLAVDVKNGIVDPKVADPIDTADVDALRKQWEGLGPTKSFAVQSEAFGRIQAAAKDPSAAGDLALIFSYMKMLDPGSVVREGEFANAQNAAGIPERIRAAYNNAMDGQRLTETTRTDFLSRADKLYAAAEQGYTALEGQYTATAKTRGYDPAQVVTDFRYSGPRLGLSSDGISTTTLAPVVIDGFKIEAVK